jgi:hypothetical protein
MTVDIWIRDYNPPRCFQKKISDRGKHNAGTSFWNHPVVGIFITVFRYNLGKKLRKSAKNRGTWISG